MNTHTPGPWTSHWDDNGFFVINPTRGYVMGHEGDQSADDARLMAAAPELLEALKGLAADVEKIARDSFSTVGGDFEFDYRYEDPDGYAVWSAARTAIAKAEGRA